LKFVGDRKLQYKTNLRMI